MHTDRLVLVTVQLSAHSLSQADQKPVGQGRSGICHHLLSAGGHCCNSLLRNVRRHLSSCHLQALASVCTQGNLPKDCRYGHELWHSILTVLSAVLMDFLMVGCAIATAGWCALSTGMHCKAGVGSRLGS